MAKKPPKKAPEIELEPDAWQRFERFVTKAAKAGPKHRKASDAARKKRPAK